MTTLHLKSDGKQAIHRLTKTHLKRVFGISQPLKYLGLETEDVESIKIRNESFNIDLSRSVIVEADQNTFRKMTRLANAGHEVLSVINRLQGCLGDPEINEKLLNLRLQNIAGPFNDINLDFMGLYNNSIADLLTSLFLSHTKMLANTVVISATFTDHAFFKACNNCSGNELLKFERALKRSTLQSWNVKPLNIQRYSGGTKQNKSVYMYWGIWLVKRKDIYLGTTTMPTTTLDEIKLFNLKGW